MPSGNVVNLTNPAHVIDSQEVFKIVSNEQDTYTSSSYNDSQIDRLFIAKFEAFGAPYDPNALAAASGDEAYSWPNSSTIASECSLWMCVQTYNASQVDKNQTESITSESSYFVSFNVDPHGGENYTFLQPYSNYTVSSTASDALTEYLQDTIYFDGDIQVRGGGIDPSNDFVQAIWYASADPEDLNGWCQTLAKSITNVIRTSGPPPSGLYDGKAYQLGVRVRWPWVILPVSLVLASLIILIATIITTSGQAGRLDGLRGSTGKIKVAMRTDELGDWKLEAA